MTLNELNNRNNTNTLPWLVHFYHLLLLQVLCDPHYFLHELSILPCKKKIQIKNNAFQEICQLREHVKTGVLLKNPATIQISSSDHLQALSWKHCFGLGVNMVSLGLGLVLFLSLMFLIPVVFWSPFKQNWLQFAQVPVGWTLFNLITNHQPPTKQSKHIQSLSISNMLQEDYHI